jgi:hypothetical protein
MTARRLLPTFLITLAAALLLAPAAAARWHPRPTTAAWQWQLQGKIDTSVEAGAYEVDGFEVGSWESYRSDADRFPQAVLGRAYEGYPDERWLDVRRIDLLAPILLRRFELCRRKGFDAIEPDNVAGRGPRRQWRRGTTESSLLESATSCASCRSRCS